MMSCDRCGKEKSPNEVFASVMLNGHYYDLCPQCYRGYEEISREYDLLIDTIEGMQKNRQQDYLLKLRVSKPFSYKNF